MEAPRDQEEPTGTTGGHHGISHGIRLRIENLSLSELRDERDLCLRFLSDFADLQDPGDDGVTLGSLLGYTPDNMNNGVLALNNLLELVESQIEEKQRQRGDQP